MFPACTTGGGQAFAFPDTCNIPAAAGAPVPTPFPNIAMLAQTLSVTCTLRVSISNMPAITPNSQLLTTSGDEGGVMLGVTSGMIMGPAAFKLGSMKVKVEGQALVTMLKPTAHNGVSANAPAGMVVVPSQFKVLVGG